MGYGQFWRSVYGAYPNVYGYCKYWYFCSLLLMKPLNALLLGAQYAESLGFNTQRIRNYLLVVTGLLSAITTAFCGPIGFIGLAVPHIARLLLTTENHRLLLPSTILSGALIALCAILFAICLAKVVLFH